MSDSLLNRAEEPDSSMPRRCKEAQQPRNKQIHLTEIRKGQKESVSCISEGSGKGGDKKDDWLNT